MTISHPPRDIPDGAFVFARLIDISCSVCAPNAMTCDDVKAYARREAGPAIGGWESVDKSQIIGMGGATPNPCNVDPAGRTHWFLLAGLQAATLGFVTDK